MSLKNVLGQKQITELLMNSLYNNRISHAYIFSGQKGVGKEKMALEFAKALNCLTNINDACNQCSNCKKITHHNHQDVILIEQEGNSIKIDQIRQLQKNLLYKAAGSKYKVFIIKQAENLTNQAANSLLKLLEEPSPNVVAILLVENTYKLLPTIKSRCQTLYFSHLDSKTIVQILQGEGFKNNDILLASYLTVNIDEIRKLLSEEQFAHMRTQVLQWSEEISLDKYQGLLSINDKILKNNYINEQLPQFFDLLLLWYRDILNIKLSNEENIVFQDYINNLNKQLMQFTEDQLINNLEKILYTKKQLASYVNPQVALENMVISLWEGR